MTIPRHAIAIAILSAAASRAAVPFAWDVPDYPAASARAQAWRGETLDLRPRWQADTNGLTFAMLWQTNGMGAAWFQDASDAFTWSPSKDCGAPSYRIFIRALGPSGASYRANLQLDILDAPGAAPNALPLPVPSIDFAALAATNAPWLLPPATNALALCLRSDSPNDTLPPFSLRSSGIDDILTNSLAISAGEIRLDTDQTAFNGRLDTVFISGAGIAFATNGLMTGRSLTARGPGGSVLWPPPGSSGALATSADLAYAPQTLWQRVEDVSCWPDGWRVYLSPSATIYRITPEDWSSPYTDILIFLPEAAPGSCAATFELLIRATNALSFPPSVAWLGTGSPTSAPPVSAANTLYALRSLDGGTNWIANKEAEWQ